MIFQLFKKCRPPSSYAYGVGTDGTISAAVTTTDDQHNTVIINIRYTVHSRARGTVLVFTPVESEAAQERNEAHNHTLLFSSITATST